MLILRLEGGSVNSNWKGVVLIQRLEGSGGVRFKEWKGVMVLIQTGRVGGWC